MSKKKPNIIEETKQYIQFLEKRLASNNYRTKVSREELQKTKDAYDKAKQRLKLLSTKN